METAHASTTRAPSARELAAKLAAVDDFHRTQYKELTGNHLIDLQARARMLNDLKSTPPPRAHNPFFTLKPSRQLVRRTFLGLAV
jgi:hypothetical protein